MDANVEIERKFLPKSLPPGWKRHPHSHITQGYLPVSGGEFEIRLRRKGTQHFLTIKGGKGKRRLEEEIEISKRRFQALWPLTTAARIAKTRYTIPLDGRDLELDIYEGAHRGLVTAEVEFDSIRESEKFHPPDWFGLDITGDRKFSNASLARARSCPRRYSQKAGHVVQLQTK